MKGLQTLKTDDNGSPIDRQMWNILSVAESYLVANLPCFEVFKNSTWFYLSFCLATA